MTILSALLFGTALTASLWTLYASVRPQLHRYRALFAPASTATAPLPARAGRPAARRIMPRPVARQPLRAAA